MSDHHAHAHGHGGGHENKDVKLRGIIMFMVVLALSVVVIELILGLWMAVYADKGRVLAGPDPAATAAEEYDFPAPELQGNPGADMKKFLAVEGQALDGYHWTDEKAHIARLPIERGIDAVVARGFRVHQPGEAAPAASAPRPAEAPKPATESAAPAPAVPVGEGAAAPVEETPKAAAESTKATEETPK